MPLSKPDVVRLDFPGHVLEVSEFLADIVERGLLQGDGLADFLFHGADDVGEAALHHSGELLVLLLDEGVGGFVDGIKVRQDLLKNTIQLLIAVGKVSAPRLELHHQLVELVFPHQRYFAILQQLLFSLLPPHPLLLQSFLQLPHHPPVLVLGRPLIGLLGGIEAHI